MHAVPAPPRSLRNALRFLHHRLRGRLRRLVAARVGRSLNRGSPHFRPAKSSSHRELTSDLQKALHARVCLGALGTRTFTQALRLASQHMQFVHQMSGLLCELRVTALQRQLLPALLGAYVVPPAALHGRVRRRRCRLVTMGHDSDRVHERPLQLQDIARVARLRHLSRGRVLRRHGRAPAALGREHLLYEGRCACARAQCHCVTQRAFVLVPLADGLVAFVTQRQDAWHLSCL